MQVLNKVFREKGYNVSLILGSIHIFHFLNLALRVKLIIYFITIKVIRNAFHNLVFDLYAHQWQFSSALQNDPQYSVVPTTICCSSCLCRCTVWEAMNRCSKHRLYDLSSIVDLWAFKPRVSLDYLILSTIAPPFT